MPDIDDLRSWLRHNAGDLRTAPDMVTEAAGPIVRFRWHGLAHIGGVHYGVGIDLRPGPRLGEIWMYGHGAKGVRLQADDGPFIPYLVRALVRSILVAHASNREHDWGRGAWLGGPVPATDAVA